ncbi:precorrin-6y C5,15-methyltransferase (decarboxylating) subunit CbiE [Paracoccaceae bacterium]|nr:precorrin-6y C5,15-methyltransferase (decarboxylating) subunit CbiE [Paracoccaceae bacterium]
MNDIPWLTIIGMDAGGYASLSPETQLVLKDTPIIMAPSRHLASLPKLSGDQIEWPVPFSEGIEKLLTLRGNRAVVIFSGDPFWFGAGSQITQHLDRKEWRVIPAQSCFSLAAGELGWPIERTVQLGLHSAPFSRLRPYLVAGQFLMVTLRDGEAIGSLSEYLIDTGFGDSELWVLESLGSINKNVTKIQAKEKINKKFQHPLMVGIKVLGSGKTLSQASGLSDDWFVNDGQITKQPIRALTLSALAPQKGQHLWDLGSGSGSIAIEWLLSGSSMKATAVEKNLARAENINLNASKLGVDWVEVIQSDSMDVLNKLDRPDAVFIGGGFSTKLFAKIWEIIPVGTRVVVNGVTIETDHLIIDCAERFGGQLLRFEYSQPKKIGGKSSWKASYPITQWVVVR